MLYQMEWGIGIEHEVMVIDKHDSFVSGDEIIKSLRTGLTLNTSEIQQFVRSFIHGNSLYATTTGLYIDLEQIEQTALKNIDDHVLNTLFSEYATHIIGHVPFSKNDLIKELFDVYFLHDETSLYHTIVEFATIHWKSKTITSSIHEIQLRQDILLRCIELHNQEATTGEAKDVAYATVGCMFPIQPSQQDTVGDTTRDGIYGLDYTGSYHINISLPYEKDTLMDEYGRYESQSRHVMNHFMNTFNENSHQHNVLGFVNAFERLMVPLSDLHIDIRISEYKHHMNEFDLLETEIMDFVREGKVVLDGIVFSFKKTKKGLLKPFIVYKQHDSLFTDKKKLDKISILFRESRSQYLDARIEKAMNQSSAEKFYITFTDNTCSVVAAKSTDISKFFLETNVIYTEKNAEQFTHCMNCAYLAYNQRILSLMQDLSLDIKKTLRNNGEYHRLHSFLAIVLQWLSPLVLSCYGFCDPFSIGDNNKLSELSCRLFVAGYSFINSSNIMKYGFPTERHLSRKHRQKNSLEQSVLDSFAYDLTSVKQNGFGADFRRYSSKRGFDEYQFGFELRIFDNFDIKHLNELLEFIFLLSDHVFSLYEKQNLVVLNPFNHEQLHDETVRILKQGWNTVISHEYFVLIQSILKLPFPFSQGMYASQFLNSIYEFLQEKYVSNGKGIGKFSKHTIDREPGIHTIPNLNRQSWEYNFRRLIWNPFPKTHLREVIEDCYRTSIRAGTKLYDELVKTLDERYKDDIDDIYFAFTQDILNTSSK